MGMESHDSRHNEVTHSSNTIINDMTWTNNTLQLVKKAQQTLLSEETEAKLPAKLYSTSTEAPSSPS